jgi:ATP-dependent Clp protease ATP-binding subunit ClpB
MESGFDPQFGARPLRRAIQKAIGDPLAMKILAGEIPDGSQVSISAASPNADHLEITLAV